MKFDIVDVFGESYARLEEKHPDIVSFCEQFGSSPDHSVRVRSISTEGYLAKVIEVCEASRDLIKEIISREISLEDVRRLKDFYAEKERLRISGGDEVNKEYMHFIETNYLAISPIDRRVHNFVNDIILSHSENKLINEFPEPVSLVWRPEESRLVTVLGSPQRNNGHGNFIVNEYEITSEGKTMEDDAYSLKTETLEIILKTSIVGQGIYSHEDLLKVYKAT